MALTEPADGTAPAPNPENAAVDAQDRPKVAATAAATSATAPSADTATDTAAPPASEKRGVSSTHVAPALSLVLGALVLLPTTTGQLLRPFVWEVLLPAFVLLASLSAVLLIVAALLGALSTMPNASRSMRGVNAGARALTKADASHVLRGVGTGAGVLGLLALVFFLGANYCDNLFSTPRVLNIKFTPVPLVAGKVAEAELEILNKSAKPIHYEWIFNGHVVPGTRTAYLRLPDAPGRYAVEVALRLAPKTGPVDTGASAPTTTAEFSKFNAWVDVLADSPTPPPPIVVPCCKGAPCEKQKPKPKIRKIHPASNPKSCS